MRLAIIHKKSDTGLWLLRAVLNNVSHIDVMSLDRYQQYLGEALDPNLSGFICNYEIQCVTLESAREDYGLATNYSVSFT